MKILAIDLGLKRVGLAVSDEKELIAIPVGTVKVQNIDSLIKYITEFANKNKVEQIVLGLPKNMDGTEGQSAKSAREFGDKLFESSWIEVIMRDERITTVSAHNYLNQTNTRGKKRKDIIDCVSAVIILQDYLDFRKNTELK